MSGSRATLHSDDSLSTIFATGLPREARSVGQRLAAAPPAASRQPPAGSRVGSIDENPPGSPPHRPVIDAGHGYNGGGMCSAARTLNLIVEPSMS